MKSGLPDDAIAAIHKVLAKFPAVETAILYGSRAKGNFRAGSDIDLTLIGTNLTTRDIGDIDNALDDLLLPWRFDLSRLTDIDHAALRDHIDRIGVVFYQKTAQPDDTK